jgi:hypothetical protein
MSALAWPERTDERLTAYKLGTDIVGIDYEGREVGVTRRTPSSDHWSAEDSLGQQLPGTYATWQAAAHVISSCR